jgi:hypothetical protein
MKILKSTDVIKLTPTTENPFSVFVSPLTVAQKLEVASKVKMVKGEEVSDSQAQAFLCIKYCVKDLEGVKNYDDSEYKPDVIDGVLTDSAADDIMSLLADAGLILPVIMSANKTLSGLKDVSIEVNPKK